MASNVLNLIDGAVIEGSEACLAITQGKTYSLPFTIEGDYTAGVFRGQIRDNYAQDSGNLLATFTIGTPTFDGTLTSSSLNLTDEETAVIAATRFQGAGDATDRNCWVYDVEYEVGGAVSEIFRGVVQVKKEVTV